MSASRNILLNISWLFLAFLLLAPPSFAEMKISENQLPADAIVEDVFKGGRGLPVGKIQAVRGEVIVYHQEPTVGYRVKAGLPLYHGDTIKTRINGRILCRLIDGTIFSLVPETTLTIFKCNYNSGRKESEAFLSLTHGDGRFQVKAKAGVLSHEFKIQTQTAFAEVQNADFIIRASLNMTEIISFERSRLEVTNLAEPETSFFVTDYQRVFVQNQLDLQSGPQMVETVTQDEAEEMIAKTRLLPQNYLFASSPEKYSIREEDTAAEVSKSGSSYDEFFEIFNPDPQNGEVGIED
ncbi:MAG: FecR domain-containing protein [Desulfobacteraceae bacterium]|jgi:hypothetical protein|nr:FecR domain-containing protein [Desulfobacteraceae bacterium]